MARKPSPASVKAAADRAEARARGEPVTEPKVPVEPPVEPTVDTPRSERRDSAGRFTKGWKGGGRKTKYTEPLGRAICKMLAAGMTLNQICKRPNMPDERRVRAWASDVDHPFSPKYLRARELGYLKMADDLVDISDDGSNDWMERKRGEDTITVVDHEHIARSKLRIDTRKWLLSKALPKIYGDKTAHEVSGPDGAPIEVKDSTDLDVARKVAFMLGRAVGRQEKAKDDAATG